MFNNEVPDLTPYVASESDSGPQNFSEETSFNVDSFFNFDLDSISNLNPNPPMQTSVQVPAPIEVNAMSLGHYKLGEIYHLLQLSIQQRLDKQIALAIIEKTLGIVPNSLEIEFFNYMGFNLDWLAAMHPFQFNQNFGPLAHLTLLELKNKLPIQSTPIDVENQEQQNLQEQQNPNDNSNQNFTTKTKVKKLTAAAKKEKLDQEVRESTVLDKKINDKIAEAFASSKVSKRKKITKETGDITLAKIYNYIAKEVREEEGLKENFWKDLNISSLDVFYQYIHQFFYDGKILNLPSLSSTSEEELKSAETIKDRFNTVLNLKKVNINIYSLREIYQVSQIKCERQTTTPSAADYLRVYREDLQHTFPECVGISFEKFRKCSKEEFEVNYKEFADLTLKEIKEKRRGIASQIAVTPTMINPPFFYYPTIFNYYALGKVMPLPPTVGSNDQFTQFIDEPLQNNDNNQSAENTNISNQPVTENNSASNDRIYTLAKIHKPFYEDNKTIHQVVSDLKFKSDLELYQYIHQFVVGHEILDVDKLKKLSPKKLCKAMGISEGIYNQPINIDPIKIGIRTLEEFYNASKLLQKGKYPASIHAIEGYLRIPKGTLKTSFVQYTGIEFEKFRKCNLTKFCRDNGYTSQSTLNQIKGITESSSPAQPLPESDIRASYQSDNLLRGGNNPSSTTIQVNLLDANQSGLIPEAPQLK